MSISSNEAEAIEQLERILHRLVMIEDDSKLETILDKLLPKLVLMLNENASNPKVRDKVVEVLSHVVKRVRPNSNIKLNCRELVGLCQKVAPTSFAFNFSLVFLEIGLPRISDQELSTSTAIAMMRGVSRLPDSSQQQAAFLAHLTTQIGNLSSIPADEPKLAQEDAEVIATWFLHIMLYPPGGVSEGSSPPGLSPENVSRLQSKITDWSSGKTMERQLNILKTCHAMGAGDECLIPLSLRVPIYLVAVTHSNYQVIAAGQNYLQAVSAAAQNAFESDAPLAKKLLALILGKPSPPLSTGDLLARGDTAYYVSLDGSLEKVSIAGVHLEDGPDKPYYTIQLVDGREKQTVPSKLRRTPGTAPVSAKLIEEILKWLKTECPDGVCSCVGECIQVVFACLFGPTTTPKIRGCGALFAAFVVSRTSVGALAIFAPLMLQAAYKVLSQPVSESTENTSEDGSTQAAATRLRNEENERLARQGCYEAVASLAHRNPNTILGELALIQLLFRLLSVEAADLRVKVAAALGGICTALKTNQQTSVVAGAVDPVALFPLLWMSASNSESRCRSCALEWATTLFPFKDARARLLCLFLSDDQVVAVRNAALAGLEFPDCSDDPKKEDPKFNEMVQVCLNQTSSELPQLTAPATQASALLFVRKCLQREVQGSKGKAEPFFSPENFLALQTFLDYIEQQLSNNSSHILTGPLGELQDACAQSLAYALSVCPESVLEAYAARDDWVRSWLNSERMAVRQHFARLLGILAPVLTEDQITGCLRTLSLKSQDATLREGAAVHGALCGIGEVLTSLAQAFVRNAQGSGTWTKVRDLAEKGTSQLGGKVGHIDITLHLAACEKLGQLGATVPLPLPDVVAEVATPDDADAAPAKRKLGHRQGIMLKGDVLEALLKELKSTEAKRVEAAAETLGKLCLGEPTASFRYRVLQDIFELAKKREEELQFAVGEGIKDIACSDMLSIPSSDPICDRLKENQLLAETDLTISCMDYVLLRLMWDLLEDHSPHVKGAAGVWLLVVTKGSASHAILQSRLPEIQTAFTRLLNERSEFTQEVAGKGLALVFEAAEQGSKNNLLDALIGSLTTGTRQQTSNLVSLHGTTPSGAELSEAGPSAYKEMCAVANDVGRPDLIYSFLSLASHHSAWNTRRGASFGLTAILRQATSAALMPHLERLIPRLYRYRHDPNPKIRGAMDHLWKTLVPDNKVAVKEYFQQIMQELWNSLNSRKWRERQAACAGLADVLSGKTFAQVGLWLERLWWLGLRVVDDIKDSVREASLAFVKTLATLTVRLADRNQTVVQDSEACIEIMLPFLLNKGILDKCAISQGIAMGTLQRIVKVSGDSLQRYLADLIAVLIEGMGALEPQALQYMQFHAESQSDMESLRLKLARASPLQETLDHCLLQLNDDVAKDVIPKLLNLLRTGVGLPTRSASAYLVLNMCERCPLEIKRKSSALILQLATSALNERRSDTLRSTLASALGSVAKLSSPFDVQKMARKFVRLYRSSDSFSMDSKHKLSVMMLLHALCLRGSSQVMDAWTLVLPICFIGKFDTSEKIVELCQDIWDEGTSQYGGAKGTMVALLEEIMKEIQNALGALSWIRRKQGAIALKNLSQALGKSFAPKAGYSARLLLSLIPGRIWDGKEAVLETLVEVCTRSPSMIDLESQSDVAGFEVKGDEEETSGNMVMDVEMKEENSNSNEETKDQVDQNGDSSYDDEKLNKISTLLEEVDDEQIAEKETAEQLDNDPIPFKGLIRFLLSQSQRPHRDFKRAALSSLRTLIKAFPQCIVYEDTHLRLFELAGLTYSEGSQQTQKVVEGTDPVLQARAIECIAVIWPSLSCHRQTATLVLTERQKSQMDAVVAIQKVHAKNYINTLLDVMDKLVWRVRVSVFQALQSFAREVYARDECYSLPNEPDSFLTGAMITNLLRAVDLGMEDGKYSQVRFAALQVIEALIERRNLKILLVPHEEALFAMARQASSDSDPKVISLGKKFLNILHSWR